jgi:hypothetical protein
VEEFEQGLILLSETPWLSGDEALETLEQFVLNPLGPLIVPNISEEFSEVGKVIIIELFGTTVVLLDLAVEEDLLHGRHEVLQSPLLPVVVVELIVALVPDAAGVELHPFPFLVELQGNGGVDVLDSVDGDGDPEQDDVPHALQVNLDEQFAEEFDA